MYDLPPTLKREQAICRRRSLILRWGYRLCLAVAVLLALVLYVLGVAHVLARDISILSNYPVLFVSIISALIAGTLLFVILGIGLLGLMTLLQQAQNRITYAIKLREDQIFLATEVANRQSELTAMENLCNELRELTARKAIVMRSLVERYGTEEVVLLEQFNELAHRALEKNGVTVTKKHVGKVLDEAEGGKIIWLDHRKK